MPAAIPSALPGQRASSAHPDPRRACPSGTAAWRTRAGHQSPRAGVASRSRNKGHARIRPPGGGPFQALLRRYIRNPMPAPHGLKGGPLLSGLSRPPRTRQQALHRITFCRRSEIWHTDRSAIRHFISSIAKQQMPYHQDKTFFISEHLPVRQTPSFPKRIITHYL